MPSGWQPDAVEVASDQVEWQVYLGGLYLPYKLRQDPGPANALGRIKFMLPNRFSIYLHDTAGRQLFNKPVPTFSAGCVRVEKPMALANYVFGLQQPAAQARLETLISQEEKQIIPLPDPIPVYLLYQTAWVGEGETLQFMTFTGMIAGSRRRCPGKLPRNGATGMPKICWLRLHWACCNS